MFVQVTEWYLRGPDGLPEPINELYINVSHIIKMYRIKKFVIDEHSLVLFKLVFTRGDSIYVEGSEVAQVVKIGGLNG